MIIFVVRSGVTVYVPWWLRQKELETVKEHTDEEIDLPVLHDKEEAVLSSNLGTFARDVEAGPNSKEGLGYRMLPWPYQKLPFLDESNV